MAGRTRLAKSMLRVPTIGVILAMAMPVARASGPLRVCAGNPRYFADATGKPVYLTGSHTWATLQERAGPDTPPFDYAGYLDFMQEHHHNLLRLWTWEHAAWMQFTDVMIRYEPNRYLRTGPGETLDGRPKFDVTRFDEAYFDWLRERVEAAQQRGIYVMVMLFQGFSVEQKGTEGVDPTKGNPWDGHPFNRANNVNGIDGDLNGDGEGEETHTLAAPEITRLQEAYVREVIDRLSDLDCVLWEISNESRATSAEWQYHLIDFIHEYERTKPKQHTVVMTAQLPDGSNEVLFRSPAEAVSPNPGSGYRDDPPDAHGRKVILNDTDHLWGIGGEHPWVWKCFCRGLNPIFMDPYRDVRMGHTYNPRFDPIRRSMGYTRRYAERLDLRKATPHDDLASTHYCLADPGSDYVVYLPEGGSVSVDLSAANGTLQVEWFSPATGETIAGQPIQGGALYEPGAPSAESRLNGIRTLRTAGIPVSLRVDPLFPREPLPCPPWPSPALSGYGIERTHSLDEIERLVRFAAEQGCQKIIVSELKIVMGSQRKFKDPFRSLFGAPRGGTPIKRGTAYRLPDGYVRDRLFPPVEELCGAAGIPMVHCKQNLVMTRWPA